MAKKYYRVKKDNFLWKEGAILEWATYSGSPSGGYTPIDDVWDVIEDIDNGEYVSANIVEDSQNADWFERVYEVGALGKVMYVTADKAREMYKNTFKDK